MTVDQLRRIAQLIESLEALDDSEEVYLGDIPLYIKGGEVVGTVNADSWTFNPDKKYFFGGEA